MLGMENARRGLPGKDDGGNGQSALPSAPIGVAVQVSLTEHLYPCPLNISQYSESPAESVNSLRRSGIR